MPDTVTPVISLDSLLAAPLTQIATTPLPANTPANVRNELARLVSPMQNTPTPIRLGNGVLLSSQAVDNRTPELVINAPLPSTPSAAPIVLLDPRSPLNVTLTAAPDTVYQVMTGMRGTTIRDFNQSLLTITPTLATTPPTRVFSDPTWVPMGVVVSNSQGIVDVPTFIPSIRGSVMSFLPTATLSYVNSTTPNAQVRQGSMPGQAVYVNIRVRKSVTHIRQILISRQVPREHRGS